MVVGDAYVFQGFLTPVLTQLFFPNHRLLFSHASAEVRGKNTPERKVPSTGDLTHNHQVMSPTRSPLNHPGEATLVTMASKIIWRNTITWRNLKEDYLRNVPVKFGKNPVYSFWGKFFKEKVYGCTQGRTDRRTHDKHNTITIAYWSSTSGARNCLLWAISFPTVLPKTCTGDIKT